MTQFQMQNNHMPSSEREIISGLDERFLAKAFEEYERRTVIPVKKVEDDGWKIENCRAIIAEAEDLTPLLPTDVHSEDDLILPVHDRSIDDFYATLEKYKAV